MVGVATVLMGKTVALNRGIDSIGRFCHRQHIPLEITSERYRDKPRFIDGIWICSDRILVNPSFLFDVGDLLHELGHWCLTLPEHRCGWQWSIWDWQLPALSDEAANAWEYAAAIACGFSPQAIQPRLENRFNQGKGSTSWVRYVVPAIERGHHGVSELQQHGFCQNFPVMTKWKF